MTTRMVAMNLRAGDVLLYQGTGLISNLIRLFDGGHYSHASVYDGQRIMEALSHGIKVDSVAESTSGARYVDVYRFVGSGGKPLGSPAFPVEPVSARIRFYEDNPQRYSYDAILLLAVLASTRRIPIVSWIPGLNLILRHVLDNAADVLARIAAAGQEPVICSELVYRCYAEADKTGKYRLGIRGADVLAAHAALAFAPSEHSPPAAVIHDSLRAEKEAFLAKLASAKGQASSPHSLHDASANAAALQVVADFVTPHDLEISPSLTKAGTLTLGGAG